MLRYLLPLYRWISLVVVSALLLAACTPGAPQATSTLPASAVPPSPTAPPAPTATNPPQDTPTFVPVITATTAPTNTPAPTSAPTTAPTSASPSATPGQPQGGTAGGTPDYLDDRSTATGLVNSYFNAIDRKEYLRAYSYWRDPANSLGSFDAFQQGYQTTTSVSLQFGTIGGDAGAGQLYYSVPVLLTAQTSDGKTTLYAACYVLHLSQPVIQATPPFSPLAIERGKAVVAASGADPTTLLANACSGPDFPAGGPLSANPITNTQDISKNNYLDDRSTAVDVVKSLLNAINRKEYLRAYSYWQDPATALGTFDHYQQGFQDTDAVVATFGTTTSDLGAGQYYFQVPVNEKVQTTGGATQTFVGCYTLHLGQPTFQATPPYAPIAITKGSFKQVDNNADASALMASACTGP